MGPVKGAESAADATRTMGEFHLKKGKSGSRLYIVPV
jgi:hypothetical protein